MFRMFKKKKTLEINKKNCEVIVGAENEAQTEYHKQMLTAIENWDIDAVKKCIENGVNINCFIGGGRNIKLPKTPLMIASHMQTYSQFTGMMRRNKGIGDPEKCTEIAVKFVDELLELGADPAIPDERGLKCLSRTVKDYSLFPIVKLLVEKCQAQLYENPVKLLRLALESRNLDILQTLLLHGVKPFGASVIPNGATTYIGLGTSWNNCLALTNPERLSYTWYMTSSSGIPRAKSEYNAVAQSLAKYFLCVINMLLLIDKQSRLKYIHQYGSMSDKEPSENTTHDVNSSDSSSDEDLVDNNASDSYFASIAQAVDIIFNHMSKMIRKEHASSSKSQFSLSPSSSEESLDLNLDVKLQALSNNHDRDNRIKTRHKHVSGPEEMEIKEKINNTLIERGLFKPDKDVPSLKEYCRWEIRDRLGYNVIKVSGKLPLPPAIQHYVTVPELHKEPAYNPLIKTHCFFGCLFGCMHGL